MPLRDKAAVRYLLLILVIASAGCERSQPPRGSSVTVTLPPPKPVQAAPGFSDADVPAKR